MTNGRHDRRHNSVLVIMVHDLKDQDLEMDRGITPIEERALAETASLEVVSPMEMGDTVVAIIKIGMTVDTIDTEVAVVAKVAPLMMEDPEVIEGLAIDTPVATGVMRRGARGITMGEMAAVDPTLENIVIITIAIAMVAVEMWIVIAIEKFLLMTLKSVPLEMLHAKLRKWKTWIIETHSSNQHSLRKMFVAWVVPPLVLLIEVGVDPSRVARVLIPLNNQRLHHLREGVISILLVVIAIMNVLVDTTIKIEGVTLLEGDRIVRILTGGAVAGLVHIVMARTIIAEATVEGTTMMM